MTELVVVGQPVTKTATSLRLISVARRQRAAKNDETVPLDSQIGRQQGVSHRSL
ncbi:MAG TPA: hypothetical protein VF529_10770 [Solirubrobacteraceae bacterium]